MRQSLVMAMVMVMVVLVVLIVFVAGGALAWFAARGEAIVAPTHAWADPDEPEVGVPAIEFVARLTPGEWNSLAGFVGSIQHFEPGATIRLLVDDDDDMTEDRLAEAGLYLNAIVDRQPTDRPVSVPSLSMRLTAPACGGAPVWKRAAPGEEDFACHARMSLRPPPQADPLPTLDEGRRWFCMVIATYSKPVANFPHDLPLFREFMPAFLDSIEGSERQFAFAVYLGTQVDPHWDDPEMRSRIDARLRLIESQRDVLFRVSRYPLNAPVRDITWKYNRLMQRAYADGCSFLYQFSDDAVIHRRGWAERFAAVLDQRGGFGTVGMRDTASCCTMTLGASGRAHLEVQGSFWPPRLRNWLSDDYVQNVYCGHSVMLANYTFANSQVQNMRYTACTRMHRVYYEEVNRARYRALRWLESRAPRLAPAMEECLRAGLLDLPRENPGRLPNADTSLCSHESQFDRLELLAQGDRVCGGRDHAC